VTDENFTEATQVADRWKGYCEDLYHNEEGKRIEREYREQNCKSLHHFVERLLVPSVRQQVAKPQVLMRSQQNRLFKAGGETVLDRMHKICGDLGNWRVARGMDVLHVRPTSQER